MKRNRFVRRRRWRGAVRERARKMAGKPARRLWQRLLLGPGAVALDAVGSCFAWLRDLLRFRAPRILPPPPPGEFLVIGHRGSPTKAVENTIAACERALEEDHANAVEVDVGVTRDRHAILHHDWDPDGSVAFARQAGAEFDVAYRPVAPPEGSPYRKPVCELTLFDLRAHWGFARIDDDQATGAQVATVAELISWARTKPGLKLIVLDLKVPDEKAELTDVIVGEVEGARRKAPFAFEVLYMTTQPKVLERLRVGAPDASRTFDVEIEPGLGRHDDRYSALQPALRYGNDHASIGRPRATFGGWGIYRKVLTRDLNALAARTNGPGLAPIKRVLCWTINRPREMRDLLNMGVHGILTDRPDVLRREADALLGKAVAKAAERTART